MNPTDATIVEPQATRFWHAAMESGIVDERRLLDCWASIPEDRRTADAAERRLARRAIEEGLLTIWQAQQLLAGRLGFKFDRYILLALVGEGGMGRVYLAQDTRLNRKVALKVLSRERMNNPRAVTRFQREARVGAQLAHEHLVRIYDVGEANNHHYLVMEYIEGKTIGRLIHEHGPLAAPIAARLTRQVALGLEHARLKGMIHRDVNPMNILVDRPGQAKLTDLGLAIELGADDGKVTRDGATVGTFDYIAPEQARHSHNVDTRADIYSLGCSIYHMLTGQVPFPHPSLPEKLYAHQALEPAPLETLLPGLPEGLGAVVRRMMSKSLDQRFQNPLAVASALEAFECGPINLAAIETSPVPQLIRPTSSADVVVEVEEEDEGEGNSGLVPAARPSPAAAPAMKTPPPPEIFQSDPQFLLPSIDFGPQRVSLSESRSNDRRADVTVSKTRLWGGAAVAIAALLIVALALRGPGGGESNTQDFKPPRRPLPQPSDGSPATAPRSNVVIRFVDGGEEPLGDITEAIRRASGKPGAAVVLGSGPISIVSETPIDVSLGALTIRAADGASPVLNISLRGNGPWLKLNPISPLTLIGLTIRATATGAASSASVPIIDAEGGLRVERCVFTTSDPDAAPRALAANGLRTDLIGCQFEGFDGPITTDAHADSQLKLSHCLFARNRVDTSGPTWALRVAGERRPGPVPLLRWERCTIAGYGLLALDQASPEAPLKVEVVDSLFRGHALLMAPPSSPLGTKAVDWDGRGNRYEITTGQGWVVSAPKGFVRPEGAPEDFDTWLKVAGDEPDSRSGVVSFVAGNATAPGPRRPGEFVSTDPADATVGADPEKVGPKDAK